MIGVGGRRRLGPIEMRRAQDRVAPVEPVGGASMQRALRLREQRAQHRLADQRMSEDQLRPSARRRPARSRLASIKGRIADQRQ